MNVHKKAPEIQFRGLCFGKSCFLFWLFLTNGSWFLRCGGFLCLSLGGAVGASLASYRQIQLSGIQSQVCGEHQLGKLAPVAQLVGGIGLEGVGALLWGNEGRLVIVAGEFSTIPGKVDGVNAGQSVLG